MDHKSVSEAAGKAIKTATGYWAFVPKPLPHTIELSPTIIAQLSLADQKLGRLEGLCHRLPNPHLLSGAYAKREAVSSSEIEGTRGTQADLYLFDMDPGTAQDPQDIKKVRNYVIALQHAIKRREELPLCLRLIREVHEELLRGVGEEAKTPGEFRRSQNWIGGPNPEQADFVPPPVDEMHEALDDLEKFMHRPSPEQLPALIETALVHYQFESIHPFVDGNGRTGRVLCTLVLLERGSLSHPVLYLSAYLSAHRQEYFEHLSAIRKTGDWSQWLLFFLRGIAEQADDGVWRAGQILDIVSRYRALDIRPTTRLLIEQLLVNPYVTIKTVSDLLHVAAATASAAITELQQQKILIPLHAGRQRNQVSFAAEIIEAYSSTRK